MGAICMFIIFAIFFGYKVSITVTHSRGTTMGYVLKIDPFVLCRRACVSTRYCFVQSGDTHFFVHCERRQKLCMLEILKAYEYINVHARPPPETGNYFRAALSDI